MDSERAAPGWYPVDQYNQRYWDGYEWTNHIAPLTYASPATAVPSDDRSYALIMHLGSLFVGFLVPLVMWLIKRSHSAFVDDHGKHLMNWHLSMVIYGIASLILIVVAVGLLMLLALVGLHFIFSIMGAIAANNGDRYQYPLAIPFFS